MAKRKPVVFVLPDWVDSEAWEEFENMRKRIRRPLTEYAKTLIVKELAKCKAIGDDPKDCLDRSIKNDWTDVYPRQPRPERNGKKEESPPERQGVWARKLGE